MFTIKNVKESSEQFKLASQKSQLDAMFDELDSIISRVIFNGFLSQVNTVMTGREAVYLAVTTGRTRDLIGTPQNINAIANYVNRITVFTMASTLMISSIKNENVRRTYINKFKLEFSFIKEYLAVVSSHVVDQRVHFRGDVEVFQGLLQYIEHDVDAFLRFFNER